MSQAGILNVTSSPPPPQVATDFITDSGTAIPVANELEILATTVTSGTTPVQTTGSGNTVTIETQLSQAIAAADVTKVGLVNFDSSMFSVDVDGFVSLVGGGAGVDSFSPDSGTDPVVPDGAGLVNIKGSGDLTTVGSLNTITIVDNGVDLHNSRFIVNSGGTAVGANYTTIASAIAAASSGDTVYIQEGTYTEDLTLKAGVDLCSFVCNAGGFSVATNVLIIGKLSVNYTGTVSISGIGFRTNSDYLLEATGSGVSTLHFEVCNFYAINNDGMSLNSSNLTVTLRSSKFVAAATYKNFELITSTMTMRLCSIASTDNTANTIASKTLQLWHCSLATIITTSASGALQIWYSTWVHNATNTTLLTTAGAGASIITGCRMVSGTATALSIGVNTSLTVCNSQVQSSNASAIDGAGSLFYGPITFTGTSAIVSTTTQNIQIFGPDIRTVGIQNDGFHIDKLRALTDASSPYTTVAADYYLSCDVSGGVLTIDLPDAPTTGRTYVVKDSGGDANTNNITVTTTGGAVTIDGATTFVMNTAYQAAQFIFNGTSYEVN